jgi:acyl dehydratase
MSDAETETLGAEVEAWIGKTLHPETATFPVERGYLWTSCASVENGNPLFWDDDVAADITGGPIAPPTTLSLWFRPHHWEPGEQGPRLPLQLHFDLKEALGLPEAVMTDSVVTFADPVRPGDVIGTSQVLRSVSEPKTTKLGRGRFWVIDVEYRNHHDEVVGVETFTGFGYRRGVSAGTAAEPGTAKPREVPVELPDDLGVKPRSSTTARREGRLRHDQVAVGDDLPILTHPVTATTVVLGALATRDWRPMHHDVDFAVNRNGAADIFLNTPNQQAWFERYVTDWTGPYGRLGRLRFRMRDSVYPGNTMRFTGTVVDTAVDGSGCGWVDLAVELHADERLATTCEVRVALPTTDDDNPWRRRGDDWRPQAGGALSN